MKTANRTFTVVEMDKAALVMDVRLPAAGRVEVLDLTTRAILHLQADEVSMYRHTLFLEGRKFNIMDIRESS